MIGYLFLSASIFSGAIKGFFGKKVSNKTNGFQSAVFSNIIRMLFCIPIGFAFVLFDGGVASLAISKKMLLISVFGGVVSSIFIATWLLAVQKSAFTAVDAFTSTGIVIPILFSSILYNEKISVYEIIGLILLLVAAFLMTLYNKQINYKPTLSSLLLLFCVGAAYGFNEFSYKIFQYNKGTTPASTFNFYIYVFSSITLTLLFVVVQFIKMKNGTATEKINDFDKRKLAYIAIMAVFLFCNSYFKTLAANYLPAVQIYPLAQGSAMVLSLLMAAIFFKEKIKPFCVIALIILFTGLLFINVLPI